MAEIEIGPMRQITDEQREIMMAEVRARAERDKASKENIEFVSKKKVELNKKNEEVKKQYKEIAAKISNKNLKFNKESKENGELYGSIKPKEVSSAFKDILKVEINPSQIDLRQEITQVGKYIITVNLHAEVTVSVNLQVDKIDSI